MNTKLLSRFERDMQLRGLGSLTQEAYVRNVRRFAEFFGKSPAKAKTRDVKQYLHELMSERHLTKQTVNQHAAALRFLFAVTLNKSWAREQIPMAKTAKKLPDVLSGEEVLRVLRAFDSLKHKTIAVLCYGAGLRIVIAPTVAKPSKILQTVSTNGTVFVSRSQ
jgi:integrase/recombinase XerD